jgi:hypothetical protein
MKRTVISKVSVSNMTSANCAREVPNQFIIETPEGYYFQSYNTIIAARINGKVYLDRDKWDYSTTTGKYRNQFLGEKKADTERKIASGEYTLTDLN